MPQKTLPQTYAVILAAGKGTRMKSAHAKVTHEILGKPILRWVFDAAQNAGIKKIVSVVKAQKEEVIPLVKDSWKTVEQDSREGTGGAVLSCKKVLQEAISKQASIVILSGDSPLITPATIRKLVLTQKKEKAACVALSMTLENPKGYGRILRNEKGTVEGIVEEKDASTQEKKITECNAGFYCFNAKDLFSALAKISSNNAQNEYYLTDVLQILVDTQKSVHVIKASNNTECLGINSRQQLAHASKAAQQTINDRLMTQGVSMIDPKNVWVGPDVRIARDVVLWPQTYIFGQSSVGADSIIGPNTRLFNTQVGKNCTIEETVSHEVRIDNNVSCGPRAYLRPGTHVCDGAHIGTHVEIKKSTIGRGSKVPHLSYMGDATLGQNVNIGAGSITCNYDGAHKHPTVIGNDVFVGSDTMMVAPVKIGNNAVTGAGSTITRDVPSNALALERTQQTIKEGYSLKAKQNYKGFQTQ